jgi:eukaryotic-like serine/threonine-protein kinase
VASASFDHDIRLWNAATGEHTGTLRGHTDRVRTLASSPDGKTIATAGNDGVIRLRDPVTARELLTLSGHQAPVHAASFSPDGTILATGSHDAAIKLWRAPKSPLRKMTMTR